MVRRAKSIVFIAATVLFGALAACTVSATPVPTEPSLPASVSPGDDVLVVTSEPAAEPSPTPVHKATPTAVATPSAGPVATSSPTETVSPVLPSPTPGPQTLASSSMFGPISCETASGEIQLTSHIYPPEQFDVLVPMGRMWASHVTPTDHLYVRLEQERPRGMVTSPADGRVIRVARFNNNQSPFWDGSQVEPDIRVIIAHSCDLFSIFIHLGELAPEIASIVGDLGAGETWNAGAENAIEVKAGDPIAKFGGSSFDYSLHDENVTLQGFVVPEHYAGEPWKIHTVDPFDYMTPELVSALLPKNERSVAPYGGRIDYDVPGALVGNWFMDGTVDYRGGGFAGPDYWNGHMTIAYDHVDPAQVRVSIGRDIGVTYDDCRACGGVYAVKGNAPDPASVTAADGLVKYELTGRQHASPDSTEKTVSDGVVLGTFLTQVLDDASIKTEFFKGIKASDVDGFTADAVIYRR